MAMKAVIPLLACMLLVTTMVSSIEAIIDEEIYAEPPAKAPAHEPEKHQNHGYPPKKAPTYPPIKTTPPLPPMAPGHPPIGHTHGCTEMCVEFCKISKTYHHFRPCERACGSCCKKCQCVPGHKEPCSNWPEQVILHDHPVTCPKFP